MPDYKYLKYSNLVLAESDKVSATIMRKDMYGKLIDKTQQVADLT